MEDNLVRVSGEITKFSLEPFEGIKTLGNLVKFSIIQILRFEF